VAASFHSIFLGIDCLPSSIAIGKNIGEDCSIDILPCSSLFMTMPSTNEGIIRPRLSYNAEVGGSEAKGPWRLAVRHFPDRTSLSFLSIVPVKQKAG
jgi:hypothetical protein